jgi:hypothetical protein
MKIPFEFTTFTMNSIIIAAQSKKRQNIFFVLRRDRKVVGFTTTFVTSAYHH